MGLYSGRPVKNILLHERYRNVIPIGSMDSEILIKYRRLQSKNSQTYTEEKMEIYKKLWTYILTINGVQTFDGINTARDITHVFYTVYVEPEITYMEWIEYNKENYRILDVQNFNNNKEFLEISTIKRGSIELPVSYA